MSLVKTVVDLLSKLGESNGDDLLQHCQGHTREQVLRALRNAAYDNLITEVMDETSRHLSKGKGTRLKRYRSLSGEPIPGAITSHLQDIWRAE